MGKLTIAVDIDDVIADSTETFRIRVNKRTGADLTPGHYNIPHAGYWGYYERVWKNHGLDVTYQEFEKEMEEDQSSVPFLAGASFAIGELASNNDIVIITSRPYTWKSKTTDWLKTKIGNVFLSIHFTNSKESKKTKGQLCKELGVDWLIDDNPEHCQSAIDEEVNAILFGDYGWHHQASKQLIRCKDWPAVLEFFNDLQG